MTEAPKTTTLIIVRHGETDWNVVGRIQGQLDEEVPLNETGIAQAKAVADRLRECPASMILSSDLLRARMTAQEIAAATGLAIEHTPLLRERNLGVWHGSLTEDIEARFPGALDEYVADSWNYTPENGESRGDLWNRSASALEWCFGKARGRTAIAVTHGGVVHSVIAQAAGHPGGVEPGFKADNTCISVIVRRDDSTSVYLANDITHAPGAMKGELYWTLK